MANHYVRRAWILWRDPALPESVAACSWSDLLCDYLSAYVRVDATEVAMAGRGISGVEVAVSDLSEFRSLRVWLERISDIRVEQRAGTPGPGQQGAADVLMVLASGSGALAMAVRTLPEFLRSRRSGLSVTLKSEGKELTLTADNIDDVKPLIEKLLDA